MKKIQQKVKSFTEENQLQHTPQVSTLDLVSEVGEIAKEILESSDYGEKKVELSKNLKLEIGDAFYSLICLANCLEVDLEDSLNIVLKKYQKRLKEGGVSSKNQ